MEHLKNKVIDIHSHVGISFKSYVCGEYPYAETVESLYYKQLANHVDVSVVFPLAPELFYDTQVLIETGRLVDAVTPYVTAPYQHENAFLMKEVYEICPELSNRFLPFVCFSPKSHFNEQLKNMSLLADKYTVYGIKINPALCQAPVKNLSGFQELFAFAEERNIPFLFHASCVESEKYSYAGDILALAETYPKNRFCLAHCIGFHKGFLKKADDMKNVWVDTSALKIQVQLAYEKSPLLAGEKDRFEADYSDHSKVMQALVQVFPETIVWGTDSPAYSYMVDRLNADGTSSEFRLKASYEDEKMALDTLPENSIMQVANTNSLACLFG